MTVVVSIQGMMGMAVGRLVLTVDVGMAMGMAMLMGMDQISVGVFVGVAVTVLVGMLQRNGVFHHQHRCPDHNRKSKVEPDS